DSLAGFTIPVATINITTGNKVIYSVRPDQNGHFSTHVQKGEPYILTVSCLGYKNYQVSIEGTNQQDTLRLYVRLAEDTVQLGDVIVTGKPVIVRHTLDGITYMVQNDPESKIANTFEILKK